VNKSRIEQLRDKLDQIDEQIIQLLAERQMNVDAIGKEKLVTKKATRDYEREKKLLTRARKLAVQHGLEPELINELFSLIIRASLQKQENQKVANSSLGSNKTALVIGGNGAMGRWFVRIGGQHRNTWRTGAFEAIGHCHGRGFHQKPAQAALAATG